MIVRLLATSFVVACLTFCQRANDEPDTARAVSEGTPSPMPAGVVEVAALDYAFQAPDRIHSGWTTFVMENKGNEHHFLLLSRLPEGRTFEDYGREVGMAFDTVWDSLRAGTIDKTEAGPMLGRLLPEWYASVKPMGGPGLIAPGAVARTTLDLEPGTYVMECYVKTPDGQFHVSLGMARPVTVTEEGSGGSAPAADIQARLSNRAIDIEGQVAPGEHTVAVHFDEQPDIGLGNDLHLVKLNADTEIEQVLNWMDWMNVNGLREPAPAEFVGGTQEMSVGSTAYFTVDLKPGRYAWISEVPAEKRLVKEVVVE